MIKFAAVHLPSRECTKPCVNFQIRGYRRLYLFETIPTSNNFETSVYVKAFNNDCFKYTSQIERENRSRLFYFQDTVKYVLSM